MCLRPGPVLSPASRAWILSSAACNAFDFVNDWSSPVNVAFDVTSSLAASTKGSAIPPL